MKNNLVPLNIKFSTSQIKILLVGDKVKVGTKLTAILGKVKVIKK